MPAAHAGTRAEVHDVVGGAHGVLVMLHHQDRVAHVAQGFQRLQEPLVVAWMQADARLVEDVQHAHEAATDLTGQPDALGLAAGERGRAAVEREIVQADVEEEAGAAAQFLHDLGGDDLLDGGKPGLQGAGEEGGELAHGHGAEFDDAFAADRDGASLRG